MSVVKNPFLSIWASGSVNKTLTCKAMGSQRFVMAKHCGFNMKLGEIQRIWANEFKRCALLTKNYIDNADIAVQMDEAHFK